MLRIKLTKNVNFTQVKLTNYTDFKYYINFVFYNIIIKINLKIPMQKY